MIASRSQRSDYFKLSQRNVYIFPSRAGFAYLFLLLIMLVTAINYQNSLIYLVTFFLGAIFFLSIWMCFLNLSGLEVSSGSGHGVFEGEQGFFLVKYRKQHGATFGLKAGFSVDNVNDISIVKQDLIERTLPSSKLKRGRHTIKRLRLESRFPFGLITAWTWLKLDAALLIYPKPVQGAVTRSDSAAEQGIKSVQKTDDYSELRAYQKGDSLQRINWKKYASTDNLVVRDSDYTAKDASRVRWQDYEPYGKEQRLQFMCEKVCRLHRAKEPFGLELPVITIEPGMSDDHYYSCLEQLALY